MTKPPLKLQSIMPRMDGIMKDMAKLQQLARIPLDEFAKEDNLFFDVAKARLREALEGVFNIGAHILSRIEGGRATEYKEIARKLGEHNVVEKKFADETLMRMAGYRNRLTHFYAEITAEEMYRIINENLSDIEIFLSAIKNLLQDPKKYNLSVEQ